MLAVSVAALLSQARALLPKINESVKDQSRSEAAKIAHDVYLLCAVSEAQLQQSLSQSLSLAGARLASAGGITLGSKALPWTAVDQVSKQEQSVMLPEMRIGTTPLVRASLASEDAGFVDQVTNDTGSRCTIFQRMNEDGDMLRVSTSVLLQGGHRAVGTFIPSRDASGAPNPIIDTVLRGQTYRGRALVVNEWYDTAYEPIWDAGHARVIGMLFVGISMQEATRFIHDAAIQIKVGKTGYVFVVGGHGDLRGHYLISSGGKRDGEDIWEASDAAGRKFIQELVEKSEAVKPGEVVFEDYLWQNPGEAAPRRKLAACTTFGPWDWVIGASAYEDDFAAVRERLAQAIWHMVEGVAVAATLVALAATLVGFWLANSVSRPILKVIARLDSGARSIAEAAQQVSSSSQTLAQGASEQASSLEAASASLEQMSGVARQNAEGAGKAGELAKQSRQSADDGCSEMSAMDKGMHELKEASGDIAKIIKTIDEIAFQTNLLALNAAVEAARAGSEGAGFAVVAEEVRALAQRSAQAAKETETKIFAAIEKSENGVRLSGRVSQRLSEIGAKIRDLDALVSDVAAASGEQNKGVSQINDAVREMDRVVQSNAAGAEQSAAASEELSAQAADLEHLVAELERIAGAAGAVRSGRSDAPTAGGAPRRAAPAQRPPPARRVAELSPRS